MEGKTRQQTVERICVGGRVSDGGEYGRKVTMFVGVTVDIDWSLKVSTLCFRQG